MEKINSFVLKIASRCNLNCSYCYMYNLGDETYKEQPKFMSLKTIKDFAIKLKRYCKAAEINTVQVVFHGGEPLLAGKDYFIKCLQIFKENCSDVRILYTIQTNGVTLNTEWYQLFMTNQIRVGISMDGPKAFHDEFRLFHNGKGSYEKVASAIKLGKNNGLAGILTVMNIKIPVNDYYNEIKSLNIGYLNLLYPDGHYDRLPEGFNKQNFGKEDYTPFANWLTAFFKIWKADKNRPRIRLFENIIAMILGAEGIGNQAMGIVKNGVAIVESNGSLEPVDTLRACYEGITRTHFNVKDNEIEELFELGIFDLFYNAHSLVCEQCMNCPIYEICGGGFLGNRYSNQKGFDNPSIYCKDILSLVTFIQNDLIKSLPEQIIKTTGFEKVSYQDVIDEFKMKPTRTIDSAIRTRLNSFKNDLTPCS